ncbi:T cell receptor alpha chain MC.7.G5-like [Talpa occidentalis]|uniref:T cell receptor alpha chain MC.7.G5-like n=1 Tax=Talpa occidentalis TaxID=50954 RepID=UPI0023F99736|nr:T cell receptor alpha chain MC.7.G5-like [Talpa occidentalis]
MRAARMACPRLLWTFTIFTCLGSTMAQTVTQPQPEMSVQEAESVTLNCTYDTSDSSYYLFWYKQPPSGEMIFLIRQESFKLQNATNNRFSVNFQKDNKSFRLKISDSQLEDAAMYFCAFSGPDNYQLIWGSGTKLIIKPVIKNPENVTYQLKDTESSKTLCLFTDFDSNNNVTLYKEDDYYKTNPTVLDMLSTGSKSNGAVAWSRTGPLDCSTISSYKLPTTPENFCNATLIEEGFETDMYLNNQNLLVTGLRVVFLKMVGFNVLMTLRLWSS